MDPDAVLGTWEDVDEGSSSVHFDIDAPATTARQYLRQVAADRGRCPDVVRASVSVSSAVANVPEFRPPPSTASRHSPNEEWTRNKLALFGQHRSQIARQLAHFSGSRLTISWPDLEAQGQWVHQILERPTADGRRNGLPPSLVVLKSLNKPKVDAALVAIASWLAEEDFDPLEMDEQDEEEAMDRDRRVAHEPSALRWIYALLLIVEVPLLPHIIAALRDLARWSRTKREKLATTGDSRLTTTYSLLIALVSRHFGQSDLADTPETSS